MEDHPEFAAIGGLYFTKGPGGCSQIWGDIKDPILNFRPQVPDPNGRATRPLNETWISASFVPATAVKLGARSGASSLTNGLPSYERANEARIASSSGSRAKTA